MRPFKAGESLQTIVQTAIPDFIEADFPLFVQFVAAFTRFLESERTFANTAVSPEFGAVANGVVQTTVTPGGPVYEARKLLEYRDVATSLDEFTSHFLAMFAKNFPRHTHISADLLIASLRDFYRYKGTVESLRWFFRAVFDEDADVYFPREDVLRASDGTWDAPITIKVTSPIATPGTGVIPPNSDVERFYVGQRVETLTGSAQVEKVTTTIVGQSFNQNLVVNELTLRFDTILGEFLPGQTLHNVDSTDAVYTTIYPVIGDVIISSGGSNYEPGDIVTFSEGPTGGYGYGATGAVAAVAATALNGVNVLDGGDGYITGLPVTFTSTSGSGAAATISDVVYGEFLLEDATGYFVLEDDGSGSGRFTLEDRNTIPLELVIDPFANSSATVTADSADYGAATGVTQLNGVVLDSSTESALAAVEEKPFMHPWVFTDALHSNAELANAAAVLALASNTAPFANALIVFALSTPQDTTTNSTNASIKANVIVSDTTVVAGQNTLYLKAFTGLDLFVAGLTLKQAGTGVTQQGTVTTDGTATVLGSNTKFTLLSPNTHVRFADGSQHVVRSVSNNTLLTTFLPTGVSLSANTWSVIPVGTIAQVIPQEQRFYGKVKTITLTNAGENYKTPPFVSANSMSADAQSLYYYDPDVLAIVPSDGQVNVYRLATLEASQDAGQVTKVKILNGGVNYLDANTVIITAFHGDGRTGKDATFTPIFGAITTYPGRYITSRGWLSADKFLQDADFFNDFTYVVRVAESFDRYKDILLKLLHPAGFQALGEFVEVQEANSTSTASDSEFLTELYQNHVLGDGALSYWPLDDTESYAQAVLSDTPSGYWRLNETFSGYAQAILTRAPIAYYRFNALNGTTLVDSGPSAINGVLGNVVFQQDGALADGNKSVKFDGLSGANVHYSYVPFDSRLAPTTALTACGWAYQTDWAAFSAPGATQTTLLSKTETGGYRINFHDNGVAGVLAGYVFRAGGPGYAIISWPNLATLASGWHFFALTFDTRVTRLYVDGVEVGNVDNGSTTTISYAQNNPLVIGGEASTVANSTFLGIDLGLPAYNDKIDEVAIFPTALGVETLAKLYALRTSTFANTTVVTATDATGNGFTGNLVNLSLSPQSLGRTSPLAAADSTAYKGGQVKLSGTTGPNANTTLTIEFWHKGVDAVNQFVACGPSRRDAAIPRGWQIDKRTPGNVSTGSNGVIGVRIDTSAANNQVLQTNNAVWLWDNNWHHCVLTLNQGIATWYVDGVFSANASYQHGTGFDSTSGTFAVMDTANNNNEVDEVAVYPYILTTQQIQNHYALRTSLLTNTGRATLTNIVNTSLTMNVANGVTMQQASTFADGTVAAKFDGNTAYGFTGANSAVLDLTGDMTVECWFKTANASLGVTNARLFDRGNNEFGYTLFVQSGQMTFASGNGTTKFGPVTSAVTLEDNTWHYAVATRTGNVATLYIDAVQRGNGFCGVNATGLGAASIVIGNIIGAPRGFNGSIDNMAIYNKALTPAQITKHYSLRTRTVFGDPV